MPEYFVSFATDADLTEIARISAEERLIELTRTDLIGLSARRDVYIEKVVMSDPGDAQILGFSITQRAKTRDGAAILLVAHMFSRVPGAKAKLHDNASARARIMRATLAYTGGEIVNGPYTPPPEEKSDAT